MTDFGYPGRAIHGLVQSAWRSRLLIWTALGAWALVVAGLSSLPGDAAPTPPLPVPHLDKLAHFILYAAGGLLLARGLWLQRLKSLPAILALTTLILAGYGAVDEWRQTMVEGRTGASLGDWAADAAGALAGAAAAAMLRGRRGFQD